VFAIFFPIEVAIVLVAALHLLHYSFRFFLVFKDACIKHVLFFIITAGPAAWIGARLLKDLPEYQFEYNIGLGGVGIVGLVIGFLLLSFSIFYEAQFFGKYLMHKWTLPPIGFIVGFIAGLSGLQSLLRNRALQNMDLSANQIWATGLGIGVLIDMSRITAYIGIVHEQKDNFEIQSIIIAFAFALLGIFIGNSLWMKSANTGVQKITRIAIALAGIAMMMGLI